MSIATAIQNAQQKVTNAYTAVNNKGGTLPATQNLSNLPNAISSIPDATEPTLASLTVTPSTTAQTLTPPSGTDGYNTVQVSAVTATIDSDIVASNIKSGVNILGVSGTVTELIGETRTVSITSTSGNTFTPSSGKNGITSITVTPNNQARTVTPTTSQQSLTVGSGYSGNGTITVNAVTSSIDNNITSGNIKKDVTILGVTGTYEGSASTPITDISKANYIINNDYSIELLEKGSYILPFFEEQLSGGDVFSSVYQNNTNIKKLFLSKLKTISSTGASGIFSTAFRKCTNLSYADLSELETLQGNRACLGMFMEDSALQNILFSNLKNASSNSLNTICYKCSVSNVTFPELNNIKGSWVLRGAFRECSSLTFLSFPALTSTSFGNITDQFSIMLQGVTGCTVHFPSNLQSVIGSWSDVTAGFGGTDTTVLFDLPKTEGHTTPV